VRVLHLIEDVGFVVFWIPLSHFEVCWLLLERSDVNLLLILQIDTILRAVSRVSGRVLRSNDTKVFEINFGFGYWLVLRRCFRFLHLVVFIDPVCQLDLNSFYLVQVLDHCSRLLLVDVCDQELKVIQNWFHLTHLEAVANEHELFIVLELIRILNFLDEVD
jgi:hypothetical protein